MKKIHIDKQWPNALRWFLLQNLIDFAPWHFFTDPKEFSFAARAFANEDIQNREVLVFARRQDNDDFAGLEIKDGEPIDTVICFHPTFSTGVSDRKWDIVDGDYSNVFEFVAQHVIADMQEWALTLDAEDL